jgi:CubicO group peptidase (beta-lactamase class C family)
MKTFTFVVLLTGVVRAVQAQRAGDTRSIAERLVAVETGLLPPVTIAGRSSAMSLASRMSFHNVPAVSIAVVNDGVVEWARAYGVKDALTAEPVTTETLFQAASISKPVTAMAALHFVREGKLSLDADVNSSLASWKIPDVPHTASRKVTLRDILSHRSGLTNSIGSYASNETRLPTLVEALDGASTLKPRKVRVEFEPGSRSQYSGGGFSVLQLLLGDVAQRPFDALMRETVLEPLGMRHSFFEQPLPALLTGFAATGHDTSGRPIAGRWRVLTEAAAGGLWSTPSDLARFLVELRRAAYGASRGVLDSTLAQQMLTPQLKEWGLGVAVEGKGKATRFMHSGWNRGYRSLLIGFLESGDGAVVMTNGDSRGTEFIDEVMRAIARVYDWPAYRSRERRWSPAVGVRLGDYAGRYVIEAGPQFSVSVDGSRLFVSGGPFGDRRVELIREAADRYFVLVADVGFTFRRNGRGAVRDVVVQPADAPRVAVKIE